MTGNGPVAAAVDPKKREADRLKVARSVTRRLGNKFLPEYASDALLEAWQTFGEILAYPTRDRLTDVTAYAFLQMCKTIVRMDQIDEELSKSAKAANVPEATAAIYRTTGGRNGDLIKTNPLMLLRERLEGRLWHYLDEFGMTPASQQRLANLLLREGIAGQGKLDLGDNPPKPNNVAKYVR